MADLKERIAKRIAKEFKDGDFANLGIGLPTMVANYIPKEVDVVLHSENGFAGLGGIPAAGEEDVDVVNAGGAYVTAIDRVCFFDSAVSFGLVRGGHLDITVLGAMQVAENGDLANWIVPGAKVAGMGGAMDLVVGAKKVIIAMLHTQKGQHKILDKCTLPLTAQKCVDMIVTEMGVMEVTSEGIVVTELHPDYTKEDIQAATGCKLTFAPDLKVMEEE
ncbi:MAG: 3-oxoacid CoA-transferase subunit B [Clostridiales bacterium]|nr:3-oxoacid CoA-transferase subunit B [Clostridiales bacterium]